MKKFNKLKTFMVVLFAIFSITVTYAQCTLEIKGLDTVYCPLASPVVPEILPQGSILSGPGVSSNSFSPASAGIGEHTLKLLSDTIVYDVEVFQGVNPIFGTGTPIYLSDDAMTGSNPIGFQFSFFGQSYTEFYISSNGFMTFSPGQDNGCCSGQKIPNISNPNNLIACSWEDLNPGIGGTIDYFTIGHVPNRILVLNYTSIQHYGGGKPITTQIQLHETSNIIRILTTEINTDGGTMTMGIENIDGKIAYYPQGRNAANWSAFNEMVSFTPMHCHDSIEVTVKVLDNPASLSLSTINIDYGQVYTNYGKNQTVSLFNNGCNNLSIDSIKHKNVIFSTNLTPSSNVPFGGQLDFNIGFSPLSEGTFTDTLFIYSSAADTYIILHGTSVLEPTYFSSKSAINETVSACNGTASENFYIKNTGGSDLNFNILATAKFTEDFEDGNVADWISNSDKFVAEFSNITGATGNYALKLSGGEQNGNVNNGVVKSFASSIPDYIHIRIKPDFSNFGAGGVTIGNNSNVRDGGLIFAYFYNDPLPLLNVSGYQMRVDSARWYTIEFKNIDYSNFTYDLYIDGKLIIENLNCYYNSSDVSEIMLYNIYDGVSYYDDIYVGSELQWFNANPMAGVISANDSTQITVNFAANGLLAGTNSDQLIVTTNDPTSLRNTIDVNFTINQSPELEISETTSNFGNVFVNGTGVDSIILTNLNCSYTSIDSIRIDGAGFSLAGNISDDILADESRKLTLYFNPLLQQLYSGTLRIYTNAISDTIILSGTGIVAPELSLSTTEISDTIFSCNGSARKTFTINNNGGNVLEYLVDYITPGSFTSSARYYSNGASTSHSMTPGSELFYLSITVTVNGDFSSSSEYANIYAEGILLGTINYVADDIDITKVFEISKTLINSIVADGEIEITVENSPGVDYGYANDIHTVTFDFSYTNDALVNPQSGNIASMGSQLFTVDLNSENHLSGNFNDYILVRSNDPLKTKDTITLNITVDGEPVIEVPSNCIDFGKVLTGSNSSVAFDITNTGCDTLFIDSVTFTNAEFSSLYNPFVLPEESQAIEVIFSPLDAQVYENQRVLIYSNAKDTSVCITAESVATDANSIISTDTIRAAIYCANESINDFYIKNTGEADLHYTISAEGNISGHVSFSDTEGSLSQNDSVKITCTFDGANVMPGAYEGIVVIDNNESVYHPDTIFMSVVDSFLYVTKVGLIYERADVCFGETETLLATDGMISYLWSNGSQNQQIEVNSTATYTITGNDYNGCESSKSLLFTTHKPTVDLGADQTIKDTASITLDAGLQTNYLWSTNDVTQTITVDGTELGAGNYTYNVVVTDGYGCSGTDSIAITIEEYISSINEPLANINFGTIAPNPASEYFMINFETETNSLDLLIFSMDNKLVYSEKLSDVSSGTNKNINVSNFDRGVYLIVLKTADKQMTEKLILK